MKVRIITDEGQVDIEDKSAYGPDILEDMLRRGVDAMVRLVLAVRMADNATDG